MKRAVILVLSMVAITAAFPVSSTSFRSQTIKPIHLSSRYEAYQTNGKLELIAKRPFIERRGLLAY